jgi:hypothetical protein
MMRFLQKYVFANAGLKLLALAISFLLWATYTAEPYAEVGYQVPIEFTSMPRHLEMSGDLPTSVHVRGRSALLRRMVVSDISLSVDMKDGKEGTFQIKITSDMVRAPYGATVVQVSPSQFQVTLVPRHQLASPAG